MNDYLRLFLATSALSLLCFYVVWSRVRITVLRQELFRVRDTLWDAAQKAGALNDEAYQQARERVNYFIRYSHLVSLPSFLNALILAADGVPRPRAKSDNPAVQEAIDKAISDTVSCMVRSMVYYRPFTGLTLLIVIGTTGAIADAVYRLVNNLPGQHQGSRLAHA